MSLEQEAALYTDPWYGLNNYINYDHWQTLMETNDADAKKMQAAWMWELRTYFGLNFAQV